MKTYNYTNTMGRAKRIEIDTESLKNGKYFSAIWDMGTGDLCSTGYNTKEELTNFLKNYGIKFEED